MRDAAITTTDVQNNVPAESPRVAYVGTYTRSDYRGRAEGVYVYHVAATTGALTHAHTVAGVENPSFLTLDPQRRFLYAVNETKDGGVSAFALDPATSAPTFLNRQPSRGADPCHLCVDPTGRYVLVANFTSGSIAVLPVERDGSLGEPTDLVQHHGSGPHPTRQTGPHMHMIAPSPDGQFMLAADLGVDRVFLYRLDTTSGRLVSHEDEATSDRAPDGGWQRSAHLPPGGGPRHFVFHPNGRYLFVNNEITSSITAFAYDAARGMVRSLETVSTLPADFTGKNSTAELVIAPTGRFVYCSNRGHGSVAVFAVDDATGGLTAIGHTPTGGKTPRGMDRDPSGAFLFAANQDADTLVSFRTDPTTGMLAPTGQVTRVPTPVSVLVVDH